MSNFGFTGKALTDERQSHPAECRARATVNDLSDCTCGPDRAIGCPSRQGGDCDAPGLPKTWCPVHHAYDHCEDAALAAVSGLAQVWCDKCDKPSTRAVPLTNGSTAFRCSTHAWALVAPHGISESENRALWGALNQIQKQRPKHNGVKMTPDLWKAVFMDALGHEMAMMPKLDGDGFFPMGHRSSQLTVSEFADLLTLILAWAAREGLTINHFDGDQGGGEANKLPAEVA